MLKKSLALFFIVGLVTQAKLVWGENYNFRYTKWGMTQEEVIAAEKMNPIEKDKNSITYKTRVIDKDVALRYIFAQNKLIGASYILDDNYINSEQFIQTYAQFKKELIKKYGQPVKDITQWKNDAFKNDRS